MYLKDIGNISSICLTYCGQEPGTQPGISYVSGKGFRYLNHHLLPPGFQIWSAGLPSSDLTPVSNAYPGYHFCILCVAL